MTVLFAGFAVGLLIIGAFFTFYRNREATPEFQLPSLDNPYKNRIALEKALIEWVESRDRPLATWLRALNPKVRQAIVKEVEKFCKKKKFEVAWIINQQIEDEILQMTLNQFLLQFLQSERMVVDAEADLKAYVGLVDLVQNINRRNRKQQAQLVYLQLVNNGVLPQSNIDMLLSKDRNRWENAAKSITLASRTDRPIVNLAVREHVLGEVPRIEPVVVPHSAST